LLIYIILHAQYVMKLISVYNVSMNFNLFCHCFSRVVRKAIARVYIIMHQKQKGNLRLLYKNKKYKPL